MLDRIRRQFCFAQYRADIDPYKQENQIYFISQGAANAFVNIFTANFVHIAVRGALNDFAKNLLPNTTWHAYFTNIVITYFGRHPAQHQGNFDSATFRLITKITMRIVIILSGASLFWCTANTGITFTVVVKTVAINQLFLDFLMIK